MSKMTFLKVSCVGLLFFNVILFGLSLETIQAEGCPENIPCPAIQGNIIMRASCNSSCQGEPYNGCDRAECTSKKCSNCVCDSSWTIYCNNGDNWDDYWIESWSICLGQV